MASISVSVFALFMIVNLLSVPLVSSCGECPPKPKPKPKPKPTPKPCSPPPTPIYNKCPIDTLKLGVCANLLNGVVNVVIGTPPKTPCCSLIQGLVDLEAAVCLCTAIKANVLGLVNFNLNVDLTLLLNYCGKKVPEGFICPS